MLDNQQIDHLQREKLLIERAVFRYERFARGIDGAEESATRQCHSRVDRLGEIAHMIVNNCDRRPAQRGSQPPRHDTNRMLRIETPMKS
jgi:hypothetical protein